MTSDKVRRALPPYVSYRTFHNFIDGLQQGIPARIDRSYWGDRWSGSTGTQLMSTLRFFNLIDSNGVPTLRLRQLANTRGLQKADLLKQITVEAFSPIMQGQLNLEQATYSQLEEAFNSNYQLTGEVIRKCLKFFLLLSNDAGITLSPFMTKRSRRTKTGRSGNGARKNTKRDENRTIRNSEIPSEANEIPVKGPWLQALLNKFPTFDPAWSEEIKAKWFDAFDKLLQRGFVVE